MPMICPCYSAAIEVLLAVHGAFLHQLQCPASLGRGHHHVGGAKKQIGDSATKMGITYSTYIYINMIYNDIHIYIYTV